MLNTCEIQAHQVNAQELAKALRQCETELDSARIVIDNLRKALRTTEELYIRRIAYADSLSEHLTSQLNVQQSISGLLKSNTDTLQSMVRDYSKKLDEVDELYIKELRKQSRSWFLTEKGLKGFLYGAFIGSATGIAVAILKKK